MAACQSPSPVKDNNNEYVHVPCGNCPHCLKKRGSQWSFRLMQQDKKSRLSLFVTFTYDTKHVPITRNGFMSLLKGKGSHMSKMFKNLRREIFGDKGGDLKYYYCGEYGESRMRPHYHAIIYNATLEALVGEKYAFNIQRKIIALDGKQQFTSPVWPYGMITIGQVTEASVGYVLKYMQKPGKIPVHRNDDRQPEFSLMSKGLGEGYLSKKVIAWHMQDPYNRMYVPIPGGKKAAMPRYYKDKIFGEDLRQAIGHFNLQKMREKNLEIIMNLGVENYQDNLEQTKQASYQKMHNNSTKGRTI